MTIPNASRRTDLYTGNGVATDFAYSFRVEASDELIVYILDTTDDTYSIGVLDTDYTVTGVGGLTGGNVVFTVAPTSDYKILILGSVDRKQNTDFDNQGPWHPDVHEAAFDKLTKAVIELQEQVNRCVKLAPTDDPSLVTQLTPYDGATKVIERDADGNIIQVDSYDPVWDGFSVTAPSGGYPTSFNPNTATLGQTMDMVASILNTLKGP